MVRFIGMFVWQRKWKFFRIFWGVCLEPYDGDYQLEVRDYTFVIYHVTSLEELTSQPESENREEFTCSLMACLFDRCSSLTQAPTSVQHLNELERSKYNLADRERRRCYTALCIELYIRHSLPQLFPFFFQTTLHTEVTPRNQMISAPVFFFFFFLSFSVKCVGATSTRKDGSAIIPFLWKQIKMNSNSGPRFD